MHSVEGESEIEKVQIQEMLNIYLEARERVVQSTRSSIISGSSSSSSSSSSVVVVVVVVVVVRVQG